MLHFDIYIRGFGPGREPGAERLARAFGLPLARARELVRSLPRVVKRGVPQPQIERYARLLDEIGADCELRPSPIAPAQVIAIGSAGVANEVELELDGSAMTLPPPRDEPVAVSRFAGTLVAQAGPPAAQPVAQPAAKQVSVPAGLFSSSSGPHDTLVESHPAGSLVAPHAGEVPSEPYLPETVNVPPLPPLPLLPPLPSVEPFRPVDQRAPDARLLHVHAPTLRTFDTLTETPAPVSTAAATWGGAEAWSSVPAAGAAAVRVAAATDRTQPETAPARDFGSGPYAPLAAAPLSAPRAPLALPGAMPIAAPVAPASIMPAPIVPERHSAPPPPASQPPPGPLALADAWSAVPAASGAADQLQVDWSAADRPGLTSTRPPPVAPGVPGVPLPPLSRQAALRSEGREVSRDRPRESTRPAARPSARPAPLAPLASERVTELPLWLRWTLRVLLGVGLFVIASALRQCRAVNDDIEQGLARWERRPSAHSGALPGSQATSAGPNAALGPIASEWMRSDLNQFAGGDKDRARGLVQRLEAAGALAVHVGTITELGMTKIAGELLVVLPSDATRRAAVLEVHQAMLRATFGDFAPPSRPEGDVLHVTL